MMARLTALYLVAVSLAIFLVHDPRFVAMVLALHLLALAFTNVRLRQLASMAWRLRILFIFLIALQAVFPPKSHFLTDWLVAHQPELAADWDADGFGRPNWPMGVAVGIYQIAQMFSMLLVSAIVRSAGGGRRFLDGLRGLLVPHSAVEVIDACFAQLESQRPNRRKKAHDSETQTPRPIRSLLRGDVGWIVDRLEGRIGEDVISDAPDAAGHDARLMTRITVVLMSLRMLRVAAGTGFTPGYQNVAVIPLLCLAADRTQRRWGATVVGTATGVLSVMLGLGRNGVFILPAHVLPGILIDVGWRLVGRRPTVLGCAILGAAAGFARFTGMFLVLLLLDNPELLAAIPFFSAGHVAFGALSSVVAVTLVRESRKRATGAPSV